MTSYGAIFLGADDQKLQLSRNLGDALAVIVKAIWPHNTVKQVERSAGVPPISAKNVVNGVAGGALVTKFVRSRQLVADDHWDIWIELGRQIFGEDLSEYEERKLNELLEVTEHAKANLVRLRERRLALAQSAGRANHLGLGLVAEPIGRRARERRNFADGVGAEAAQNLDEPTSNHGGTE